MPTNLDDIQQILSLALTTGYVQGERPVNLLVLSFPGAGKSDLLGSFRQWPSAHYTTYLSFAKLANTYGEAILQRKIRHFLMPDLSALVERPAGIATAEMAAWSSLIEEGVMRWQTQRTSVQFPVPHAVGLIACLTRETYAKLESIAPPGFISRFLTISYRYSMETARAIHNSIINEDYHGNGLYPAPSLTTRPIKGSPEIFRRISAENVDRIRHHGDSYGLRTRKHLQTMMKANAMLNHRTTVTPDDYYSIMLLTKYCNQTFREI